MARKPVITVKQTAPQTKWRSLLYCILVFSFSNFLLGCAHNPTLALRQQIQNNQAEQALLSLDEQTNKRNRVLIYLEKGLLLHHLERYEESTQQFLQAKQTLEALDYLGLSEQTSSLIVNDHLTQYRGEYAEHLWLHSYQMMNYLLLDQPESAAVEARQALTVLEKYPDALKHALFSKALIGLSFEQVGKVNDAYIENKKIYSLLPDPQVLAPVLFKQAEALGFNEAAESYQQAIPARLKTTLEEPHGELILLISNGYIPEKISSTLLVSATTRISFPAYAQSYVPQLRINLSSNGRSLPYSEISSDLAGIATESLSQRAAKVTLKETARVVAKHALANNVSDQNAALGALLQLAFFITEEADTRSWSSLPGRLSLLRIPLPTGEHTIHIATESQPEQPLTTLDSLQIEAGQRVFRKIRILDTH